MPSDTRIAIIGAGTAGLAAVHYLRQKGYTRITVFDRRNRVGGKCLTLDIEGRNYELGVLVVGTPYRRVRELIRRAGLTVAPFEPVRLYDTDRPHSTVRADELFYHRHLNDLRAVLAALLCQLGVWVPRAGGRPFLKKSLARHGRRRYRRRSRCR